ncbi:3-oxoacyl-ACP synthase [Urechidicola croceus]|uniref:3-oxoacyl-ACP synthase n=1 Tax=Urechidicola croceus TaxID=1850246 RepID=A0A1D8P939_9FLAO|nr:3-oxoacyl-ACP synthase [Urechidicola croceus]AOW21082.1 3-oxoacyl-ACP synthase [Urechidicola croceus]
MNIKETLYNYCESFVNNKLQTIENTIKSNQEALGSETKSSAGDKHETGRAMLQLEMEKAGQQLQEVNHMMAVLKKVKITEASEIIRLGSVVKTNIADYFIAISAGKIEIENATYYAISPQSPIGKLLIGKEKKEKIIFNNNEYIINDVL